ncbi:MAG: gluconokinase [Rhodospirillales bacterium]|nr:gluconokinase [Rhodospirillales bacterium]
MKQRKTPPVLVFMGVSGCGKSTCGQLVARQLGIPYAEGDSYHPPENVEKMRSGTPLTDEDRAPWLMELSSLLATWVETGEGGVLTCSALKRRYREVLRGDYGIGGDIRFVHLAGPFELIEARMSQRQNHYMPPGLLTSQFATLEEPAADEQVIRIDIKSTPQVLAAEVLIRLDEE